jgi:hypothetical protein
MFTCASLWKKKWENSDDSPNKVSVSAKKVTVEAYFFSNLAA